MLRATQREDASLEALIHCLESDPASVLRVLKAANARCATHGLSATSVFGAAVVLGPRELRATALRFTLLSSNRASLCEHFDYEAFWSWSLASAYAARRLAELSGDCDPGEAYVCGLLAHCGELALACAHPKEVDRLRALHAHESLEVLLEAERETFEIHRWEVSAALMGECGLPARFAAAALALDRTKSPDPEEDELTRRLGLLVDAGTLAADWITGSRLRSASRDELWEGLVALGASLSIDEGELRSALEGAQKSWESGRQQARIHAQEVPIQPAVMPVVEAEPELAAAVKAIKVLVVDDDTKLRRLLTHLLLSAGYQVVEAADGEAGLSLALQESPQIVVTDWSMPGMSGLELCRTLRRMESGRRTFVLMLTAREEEERVLDAFNSGADDYVTKPFNPRILLARVQAGRRLIELQQQVESDKVERLKQVADMGLLTRRLRTAASTDFLTELPNRRYAMSRLELEWQAAERLGRPLSVVQVDIDHFKRINDEYGHDVGDLVLKAVSDTLRARTRRGDVVCRMGGEEFLVININSDLAGAWQCAERLRAAVEQSLVHAGEFHGRMTVSLGVAQRHAGMKGPQALLKVGDAAVYEAKAAGRNTIRGERPPGAPVREAG
ncbi:MAG: diguanylate cyclase [Planctomycetes bacterium]|nr:diguanylate cyclase [Planctomycetota bacterium]